MTAHERLVDTLRDQGRDVKDNGHGKAQAQCPAHDDGRSSLSIGPRKDGKGVVVHCHAGCSTLDVVSALGWSMRDLFDNDQAREIYTPRRDYRYPDGRVVHRKPDKSFPQSGNTQGRSLFHDDRIGDSETVYVVEGEKDVEAIELVGGTAVCSAMGAGKAHLADWTPLGGKTVIIVADKDEPGRTHAAKVAELLDGTASSVRIVEAAVGKDAADHIAADKALDELVPLTEPDPVDGAELLDDTAAWYGRFIRVTDPDDLNLLALWTVHTHLVVELYTTPRLQVDSVIFGSGKTTVLDHLKRLCQNPVQAATLSSPALIPRLLESGMRTLLLDEVDRSLHPDNPGVGELIGIINSGYRFGATRPVLVPIKGGGWEASEMSTHAPVAMAGNSPHLPPDTVSRSIRILLMPDRDGTVEDSDWELIEGDAERLRAQIAAWADSMRQSVKGSVVTLAAGCIGRSKEKWRPLKRVAIAAGGDWPAIVDRLIDKSLAEDEAEREAGLKTQPPGMVMLTDLFAVWPVGETFMPTRELVHKLIFHNPDYWGTASGYGKELTETRLGRLVTQAAKVTSIRRGGVPPRGYLWSQLEPVWRRLGIAPLKQPDEPDEPDEPDGKNAATSNNRVRQVDFEHDPARYEPDEPGDQRKQADTAGFAGFVDFAGLKEAPIQPDEPARMRIACQCGRPAPVNPETGLCHWCAAAASKEESAR
jgi:5S rRNA maturation endonuclease (ribonuclease M5)